METLKKSFPNDITNPEVAKAIAAVEIATQEGVSPDEEAELRNTLEKNPDDMVGVLFYLTRRIVSHQTLFCFFNL